MISKKYSQTLFMIFMSFGMSVIMSGVVTAVNTGINDGFLVRYFNSWLFAFPVATGLDIRISGFCDASCS